MAKRKLTNEDFCRAARRLGCEVAAIKAVAAVESRGTGFYPDGFPAILFERHKFYKHANRSKRAQWAKEYPSICNPSPTPRGGYGSKQAQRQKFSQAFALDSQAAMMACSWGIFQELGENYDDYGFNSVDEFVDLMKSGADGHLEIFVRSIIKRGLTDELRRHDWAGFARNYNGAGYKRFNYDVQMRDAYAQFSKEKINCAEVLKNSAVELKARPSDEQREVQLNSSIPTQTNAQSPNPETQIADQFAAKSADETVSPDFVPEKKEVFAPPPENSTATATKMTIAGFAVPTFLVVIIQTAKDLISQGFVDAKQVGDIVLQFILQNTRYVFYLILAIIVGLMLKKAYRQITLWIQMWLAASPDKHDVEVKPQ